MLDVNDYQNLLKLLQRVQFNGLAEAMVGVQLKDKLMTAMQPPKPKDDTVGREGTDMHHEVQADGAQ